MTNNSASLFPSLFLILLITDSSLKTTALINFSLMDRAFALVFNLVMYQIKYHASVSIHHFLRQLDWFTATV